FVRSMASREWLRTATVLVATSLALAVIMSEALLYLHVFTGARVIAILAIVAIVGMLWPGRRRTPSVATAAGTTAPTKDSSAAAGVELDRSLPVLLLRIGRYPVYHGTVGQIRSLGRAGVPVYAIVEDAYTPAALSRYLTGSIVWPTRGDESEEYLLDGLSRI